MSPAIRYQLPDYSHWLTPAELEVEDKLWLECEYYKTYASLVLDNFPVDNPVAGVCEFGCGTGLVPTALPQSLFYLGIDANPGCIDRARTRNSGPYRNFSVRDIRTVQVAEFDVTCAFAVLKHFALFEWDTILAKVLAPGRRSVFTIPLGDADVDDGTAYPHVRISRERLGEAVAKAGHRIVSMQLLPFEEYAVFTARHDVAEASAYDVLKVA